MPMIKLIEKSVSKKANKAYFITRIEATFSVRLVPNQTVDRTFEQFKGYIEKLWRLCKSANSYELNMKIGCNPWQEDPSSIHYDAAAAAIQTVCDLRKTRAVTPLSFCINIS